MSSAQSPTLTLYTRAGCPLCEEMAAAVAELLEGTRHRLLPLDIDRDPALKTRYGWDVPLLFAGDVEICRHELDLTALREWLSSHR